MDTLPLLISEALAHGPATRGPIWSILTDALQERLSNRVTALRMVCSLRKIVRKRKRIAYAMQIISERSPIRRSVANMLATFAGIEPVDCLHIAITRFRQMPVLVEPGAVKSEAEGCLLVPSIWYGNDDDILPDQLTAATILVGARELIALSMPFLMRVYQGIPADLFWPL